jgi:hypothetical protein
MREAASSYDLAHHALHALGSRALGFSQELFDPGDGAGPGDATAAPADMASQFPHLAAMLTEIAHDDPGSTLGWCDDQTEFEFGLDLILNGLDGLRPAPRPPTPPGGHGASGEVACLVAITQDLPGCWRRSRRATTLVRPARRGTGADGAPGAPR